MQPPIKQETKMQVFRFWLAGVPRDEIARELNIGAGTVTNIMQEFQRTAPDLPEIRILGIELRHSSLTPSDAAKGCRIMNLLTSFKINDDKFEDLLRQFHEFIVGARIRPEDAAKYIAELHKISKEARIPLSQVPAYVQETAFKKEVLDNQVIGAASLKAKEESELEQVKKEKWALISDLEKFKVAIAQL